MGPQPSGCGNSIVREVVFYYMALQWGRSHPAAEITKSLFNGRTQDPLQWGRSHPAAEMCVP